MRIEDHLDDKTLKQLDYKRKKRKSKEKLSERDLAELMGTNRDRYTRRHGAIRRK